MIQFFIDPIVEQRKMIGEVADAMVYHANIYANPNSHEEKTVERTAEVLRQKASLLRARSYAVPWYSLLSRLHIVPTMKQISEATRGLIGLSNSIRNGDPRDSLTYQKEIREALRLPEA
jgi:hypothetical protein